MATVPNNLKLKMAEAFFTVAKTYKMSLHSSSMVPDEDMANFSDLTNEVSGTGYVAGGDDIGDPSSVALDANGNVIVDWDDYTFTNLTVADILYAVVYEDTGVAATSTIIGILSFGTVQSPSAIDLIAKISVHGVLNVT